MGLADQMYRFRAETLARAIDWLEGLTIAATVGDPALRATAINEILGPAVIACDQAGLQMSAAGLRFLIVYLDRPDPQRVGAETVAADARRRLVDELGLHTFFGLSPDAARLYELEAPFGENVLAAFPSTQFDIAEAAKCSALGRGTACVFHLMRVMEVGLRALGGMLGIAESSNRNWEAILGKAHGIMSQPYKSQPPDWVADKDFLEGAAGMLQAVKTAWRNPTMHPEKVYTEEEAQRIYTNVETFMRHLATKLSEPTVGAD